MTRTTAPQINVDRVLGLDPGLRATGWGVIEVRGSHLYHVAHGTVRPDTGLDMAGRLRVLHLALQEILKSYSPTSAAVEETFVNTNASTTLKLGQARGVVLLAPALHNLAVGEYAANQVKKTIVGKGHATKEQMMMMVPRLLRNCDQVTHDEADALAVAICHAHSLQTGNYWSQYRTV